LFGNIEKKVLPFIFKPMSMQAIMKPELIEKEAITALSFSNTEKVKQHPALLKQIEDATILGNSHHSKVSIIFQDDEGLKRVDTTIWAAGTKFVCLKGGIWIPIDRIVEVKV
jgi:uncharacterized protein (UPF0248 family)